MAVKLWTTLVLPMCSFQSGLSNLDLPVWRGRYEPSELALSARRRNWSVRIDPTNWSHTIAQNFMTQGLLLSNRANLSRSNKL